MTNDNTPSSEVPKKRFDRRSLLRASGSLAAAGLLAGCSGGGSGGSDGGSGSGGSDGGSGSDGSSGSGGSQNTDTPSLKERAQQEGVVNEATSITGIKEFYGQFEEDTGVKHERFRSDATKVATRILQEYQANQLSFDFHRAGDPVGGVRLAENDVYIDIPDAIAEKWPDRVRYQNKFIADWFGLKLALLYNKDMVSSPPSSLEEMANNYAGKYTVDVRDDWIRLALIDRHGKEKANQLVQKLGEGAVWKESHYTAAKNVASGEVPMGLTYNKFKYYDFGNILNEQDLSDLPKVVRQIASGLLKEPKHPAAAELYMKYTQENIWEFLQNSGRPDAYFNPDDVIGNDEYYTWDFEKVSTIDLEESQSQWEELTGLTG